MIDAELAALFELPCSLIVGTVDGDLLPDACRGWGVEVLGPDRVRVLISTGAVVARRNLEGGGAVALTATHFSLFDSFQIKGHAELVEHATAEDLIRFDRYCAGAARAISESDGTPEELVLQFMTEEVFACVMTVESMFDQTPGRSAGTQLAPEPT